VDPLTLPGDHTYLLVFEYGVALRVTEPPSVKFVAPFARIEGLLNGTPFEETSRVPIP